MAIRTVIECDFCSNLILPGDIIGKTGVGILRDTDANGSAVIEENASLPTPLTFCASCSNSLSETLSAATEAVMAQAEPEDPEDDDEDEEEDEEQPVLTPATIAGSHPAGPGPCSGPGVCCPTCDLPDRCCAGFSKADFRGFGVTEAQYNEAVKNLGFDNHVRGAEAGIDSPFCSPQDHHEAGRCYNTAEIRAELQRMGAIA